MAEDLLFLQLARTSTNGAPQREDLSRLKKFHGRGLRSKASLTRKKIIDWAEQGIRKIARKFRSKFQSLRFCIVFFLDNFGKKLLAWRCCSRFFLRLPPRSRSQIAATGGLHVGTHQVQLIAIRGHYFLLCEIREFLRVPWAPLGNRLWDGREWEEEGQSRK